MPNPTPQRSGPRTPGSSLWHIRDRLEDNFRAVRAILRRLHQDDEDAQVQIQAAAELRHHIALAKDTLEAASRAEAVQQFENIVLDALEQASPALRRKVIDSLNATLQQLQSRPRPRPSPPPPDPAGTGPPASSGEQPAGP